MRRFLTLFSVFVFTLLVVSSFVLPESPVVREARAGEDHNVKGWIWGSNTGWISMNCENEDTCGVSNYGVNIDDDTGIMSGYAWNNPYDDVAGINGIGWLSFNQSDLTGCPEGECIAKRVGNELQGWARFLGGEDPNGGGVDEDDIYGSWGPTYDEPANTDTAPGSDEINDYVCEDGENGTYTDVEQVDPGEEGEPIEEWNNVDPLPAKRYLHGQASYQGKIYVVGGCQSDSGTDSCGDESNMMSYDPDTGVWTDLSSMSFGRRLFQAAELDGLIYAVSGNQSNPLKLRRVEAYDPVADDWSTKANLPMALHHPAVASGDGKIFAFGGDGTFDDPGMKRDYFSYNPSTNSWTDLGTVPVAFQQPGNGWDVKAENVNGMIYLVQGRSRVVYQYNPSTGGWAQKANLPTVQWDHQLASANGKLYAISGGPFNEAQAQVEPNNNVYEYNPGTNSWTSLSDIGTAVSDHGASAIGCKIYATGGYNGRGNPLQQVMYSLNQEFTSVECDEGGGSPATYRDRTVQCISEEAPDTSSGWDGWMKLSGNADDGSSYGVTIGGPGAIEEAPNFVFAQVANAAGEEGFEESYSWGDDVIGWVDWNPAWIDGGLAELTVAKFGLGSGHVGSVPGGIDCGPDCLEEYDPGTLVGLMATPDENSYLEVFIGCTETGTNSCEINMSGDSVVSAWFLQNEAAFCGDGIDNDEDGTMDTSGGEYQPGDMNQDGDISNSDVTDVLRVVQGIQPLSAYRDLAGDVHPDGVGDGVVDIFDVVAINRIAVDLDPWPDLRTMGADPECADPETYTLDVEVTIDGEGASLFGGWFALVPKLINEAVAVEGFNGWGDDAEGCDDNDLECSITMNSDKLASADFGPDGGFVKSIAPPGIIDACDIDGGDCTESGITGGTVVVLRAEICNNGIDDNENGEIDEEPCPQTEEICGNGIDDDGDGEVDEDCPEEICDNGIDDDGDGEVDEETCEDPDCPECGPDDGDGTPELFLTVVDQDGPGPLQYVRVFEDGSFRGNCFDSCTYSLSNGSDMDLYLTGPDFQYWAGDECDGETSTCEYVMGSTDVHLTSYFGEPEEPPEPCLPGGDDDGDGVPNEEDPDCQTCPAAGPENCPACNDGIDNEDGGGDGFVDWNGGPLGQPADPACAGNEFLDTEGGMDQVEEI